MAKQDDCKPVPSKRVGRPTLSSEDEKGLFDAGSESAGCEVAYNAAVISSNTLLRAGEIRQSRLRDLDLERRTIACSNKNGPVRDVPLNGEAYAAVKRLWDRAQTLGSTKPEHYLLPRRRKGGTFDPTRPQGFGNEAGARWWKRPSFPVCDSAISGAMP